MAGKNTVVIDFDGEDTFLDNMEAKQLIRINVRSKNRAEVRLLHNTKPREVLQQALISTDDITRFELVEPSMREIFVTAVTEQENRIEQTGKVVAV